MTFYHRSSVRYAALGLALVFSLGAPAAESQVIARAAVNGASFMNSALPNGKLARVLIY